MTPTLPDLVDFAVRLADTAGKRTLAYYQTDLTVDSKSDESPVTIADREAELLIRQAIEVRFPDHRILGEEFGDDGKDSPYKWIIDPIDGTKSFITGVPFYANLIGLEIEGEVVLGISNFPALGEMMVAATGMGTWINGCRVRVSSVNRLKNARVMITDLRHASAVPQAAGAARLLQECKFYRTWGDAYGHYLVAAGRADVALDPHMNPWDCAPFGIILKEAGGWFGDWDGKDTIYGPNAVSANPDLIGEVLTVLKG